MEGNICQVSHLKNIKLLCNWYQLTRKEARRRDSSFFFQLNNFKKCVASFFIYAVSEKISTHLITIQFLFINPIVFNKNLKTVFWVIKSFDCVFVLCLVVLSGSFVSLLAYFLLGIQNGRQNFKCLPDDIPQ